VYWKYIAFHFVLQWLSTYRLNTVPSRCCTVESSSSYSTSLLSKKVGFIKDSAKPSLVVVQIFSPGEIYEPLAKLMLQYITAVTTCRM
jgi:hypothetical protein